MGETCVGGGAVGVDAGGGVADVVGGFEGGGGVAGGGSTFTGDAAGACPFAIAMARNMQYKIQTDLIIAIFPLGIVQRD